MNEKIKVQIYLTKVQRRYVKSRSAKLGYRSMGDYLWSLVEKDLDLDELQEIRISQDVN